MAMAHGDGPPKAPGEYPREGYDVLMCVLHLSRSLRADFAGRFPLSISCFDGVDPSFTPQRREARRRRDSACVWCARVVPVV